eukprot:TRINITY_DN11927_c0_g1_i9.p1 TRINITY_DN11927_c0_g1~~TRINITY_DN11927_c0_g1_i9.p1  ORF type:complete len:380 (+),score=66.41 TRINITY_DN11927_c0_g1_i9:47-1186(+)
MAVDKECRDALKNAERSDKKSYSPKKPGKIETKKPEADGDLPDTCEKMSELIIKDENESSSCDNTQLSVYKRISAKNHFLNMQDLASLKKLCAEENLTNTGKKAVVIKRLKEYFKTKILREAGLLPPPSSLSGYEYMIVIDFEATCDREKSTNYPHEIIEFPAVLVNVDRCEIVDSWRRYVRPTVNPVLSTFCTDLTGITQETVDKSEDFPTVLQHFQAWLTEKRLGIEHAFAIVTDGPFDIARFLYLSCQHNQIEVPTWATRWINVKKCFVNFYRKDSRSRVNCLQDMLVRMNLKFEGTPHCGLDDATNIARVVTRLLKDGAKLRVNERLDLPGQKDRRFYNVAPVPREEATAWLKKCQQNLANAEDPSQSTESNNNS